MRVLVVNAGSSSLKLSLIADDERTLAEQEIAAPRSHVDEDALADALGGPLGQADAVGHRIVHGGSRFHEAVRIDPGVREELGRLTDLAPLHQPKSLAALDAVSEALREPPSVACFDTAFHAAMPPAAATYALPAAWRERWGIRRYGFHGLSHAWVARRAPQLLGVATGELRIVSCHLGAGASLCAIRGGRSVDTTMGFTPLEGLVMATRSGSVDPGLLMWLLEHEHLDPEELASALEHESGLLGLAGSADMREVLERVGHGDESAGLAMGVYMHRLCASVAGMAAAMGGMDALVFTGGVGEKAHEVRERAGEGLAFLGVQIDRGANRRVRSDAEIGAPGAPVRSLVLEAREDLEIARQVRALLG